MKTQTKLNLGCGRDKNKTLPYPWLNVDVSGDAADINCDIMNLPLDWTERFEEVRISHVLEHFFLDEFDSLLSEWIRVLAPGGELRIIVPDLDVIIQGLLKGFDSKGRLAVSITETTPILSQIYGVGYQSRLTETPWRHRFLFNKVMLFDLLNRQESLEFVQLYNKEDDPANLFGIKDDSQNSFSICIHAFKKRNNGNFKT